jgi:hypothetical protein
MIYTYSDSYLKSLVTEEIEARALADVNAMGDYSNAQKYRLVPLRAYIIVCLENVAANDDVFSVKLKEYLSQYKEAYNLAKAEANKASTESGYIPMFGIGISRS